MLRKVFLGAAILFCFGIASLGEELSPIKLLPPDMTMGKSLKLTYNQHIILAQTVGYPQ